MHSPLVIGVSGGVASGKSLAARLLAEEAGGIVLDADRLARNVLDDPHALERVREAIGADVFAPDGTLDRAALARRVFGDPKAKSALEAIVHPPVLAQIRSEIRRAAERRVPLVVVDAPLLHESGLDRICDAVLFVDTPVGRREEWARARGWSAGERERREKNQKSVEVKKRLADYIIDNSGSVESLRAQVRDILRDLSPRIPPADAPFPHPDRRNPDSPPGS